MSRSMAMAVKLDEDLSPVVAEPLLERGHEVRTVHGQGWSGASDSDLWKRLMAEDVYFITADKGFGDLRIYTPGTHSGILLLRPERESLAAYRDLLRATLDRTRLDELHGAVSVASASGLRIRRHASE